METRQPVHIIGAGLAGSEAALQLAARGVPVVLHEMRPVKMTEAHQTSRCAELVCSNSFKSRTEPSAPSILKQELKAMGSFLLDLAYQNEVPGGEALSVDRDRFSASVDAKIRSNPLIELSIGEVREPFPDAINLIATGPLTGENLTQWIQKQTESKQLYFYDAIAPIVDAATIDFDVVYGANRYDKGEVTAYLNCPFTETQYQAFLEALLMGEQVPSKNFEKENFYQGCQPIEAIAASGSESLRFGPMKPVGLIDPKTGRIPHAVVQLRPENLSKSAYNLVGFQTKLKYGEQLKVLRKIPGLEKAEFFRYGSVHRNTYLCGPRALRPDLSLKRNPKIYFAGQITGVEGYLESVATGLLASHFIWNRLTQNAVVPPPANSALGSLLRHVLRSDPDRFQPSGIHFGLFETLLFDDVTGLKRDQARQRISTQSLENILTWSKEAGEPKSAPQPTSVQTLV